MNKLIKILSFVSISLLILTNVQAQEWNVSAEEKAMELGVTFTEEIQDAGNSIYKKSCKMCHGDVTIAASNDRELPLAPNLGATDWQKANTDGEIFTKITSGKGGMPPFSGSLSDDDRWKIVAFIRSNYDAYIPPNTNKAAEAPKVEKFAGTIKDIETIYNDAAQSFTVRIIAIDDNGHPAKAKGVKVDLFVKRYFGNMALFEGERTDENGEIVIEAGNLKADNEGNISIIAQTSDKSIISKKNITISYAQEWENPILGRNIWGTSARTPIWMLVSYLVFTFGTLSVLGWAVFQLLRIHNLRER
ncbi:MAG: c-type cytochrome [Bacteroidales bacterium]|nr:c-type cytochrome [Bacteroidales bacterium]